MAFLKLAAATFATVWGGPEVLKWANEHIGNADPNSTAAQLANKIGLVREKGKWIYQKGKEAAKPAVDEVEDLMTKANDLVTAPTIPDDKKEVVPKIIGSPLLKAKEDLATGTKNSATTPLVDNAIPKEILEKLSTEFAKTTQAELDAQKDHPEFRAGKIVDAARESVAGITDAEKRKAALTQLGQMTTALTVSPDAEKDQAYGLSMYMATNVLKEMIGNPSLDTAKYLSDNQERLKKEYADPNKKDNPSAPAPTQQASSLTDKQRKEAWDKFVPALRDWTDNGKSPFVGGDDETRFLVTRTEDGQRFMVIQMKKENGQFVPPEDSKSATFDLAGLVGGPNDTDPNNPSFVQQILAANSHANPEKNNPAQIAINEINYRSQRAETSRVNPYKENILDTYAKATGASGYQHWAAMNGQPAYFAPRTQPYYGPGTYGPGAQAPNGGSYQAEREQQIAGLKLNLNFGDDYDPTLKNQVDIGLAPTPPTGPFPGWNRGQLTIVRGQDGYSASFVGERVTRGFLGIGTSTKQITTRPVPLDEQGVNRIFSAYTASPNDYQTALAMGSIGEHLSDYGAMRGNPSYFAANSREPRNYGGIKTGPEAGTPAPAQQKYAAATYWLNSNPGGGNG